jgi:hypothetical protein
MKSDKTVKKDAPTVEFMEYMIRLNLQQIAELERQNKKYNLELKKALLKKRNNNLKK